MEEVKTRVLLLLVTVVVIAAKSVVEYKIEKAVETEEEMVDNSWKDEMKRITKPVLLQKWGFNDCSDGDGPAKINNLDISPDPVVVPGPLYVAASIDLKTDLVAPLQANVTISRYSRILKQYIKLPCIANFGSCVYDDVCTLLGQLTKCPDPLVKIGLTSHCPIKQNSYNLPKTEFDINYAVFPAGDFFMTGNLKSNGKPMGCVNITISFE